MSQEKLNPWAVVKAEMDRNTNQRVSWAALIGQSLPKACARYKAAGLDAEQALQSILYEHPKLSDEAQRRLKIGVCTEFSRMGSHARELNKARF